MPLWNRSGPVDDGAPRSKRLEPSRTEEEAAEKEGFELVSLDELSPEEIADLVRRGELPPDLAP
jgi:hypothetical protein